MRNRIFRFHAVAFLLLTGVMASWGCGGEQKSAPASSDGGGVPASVLAEMPVAEFTAPAAPPIASTEIIAYVKVREPLKLIDRLGAWSSIVPTPMTPEDLRVQLEESGIKLDELRDGGNVAFFMFNPGPALSEVKMAGLAPVADGGSIAQAMRAQLGEANVQASGESLIFAQDIDSLTRAQGLSDALHQAADASMASDLQLYLNMETIMMQYGPMVRGYIPLLQGMVAMSGMPQDQMARAQMNMGVGMNALLDFLDQLQGVTLLVDLEADELELASVVTAKAGSALAAKLSVEPVAAPDLARFLPADDMLRAQMTYSDMAGMMDWWIKIMENTLPADSGVDMAKVKEEFAPFAEVGRTDYAFGIGFEQEGSLNIQGVMRLEDTAPMMKFLEEKMGSFNEGVLHDFYKAQGMEMSIEPNLNAREIEGYPVHQYTMSMTMEPGMTTTPEQAAMMQSLFGNMRMEVIEIKPLVAYSMNMPIDSLVQSLLDGQAGVPINAMQSYPAGGLFYGDVDFAAYLNAIKNLMPELQATGMPALPEGLPPMMMSGRNANGAGYYSVKIPQGLVKGFVDAATGASGMPQAPPPSVPSAPPAMAPDETPDEALDEAPDA